MENSIKCISTINPAIDPTIVENMECPIIKASTLFIDLKVGVSLSHGVSLRFVSSYFKHIELHSKQRIVLEASLLALHLPKSCSEAITRVLQIATYVVVERRTKHKRGQR